MLTFYSGINTREKPYRRSSGSFYFLSENMYSAPLSRATANSDIEIKIPTVLGVVFPTTLLDSTYPDDARAD
jgi:hypothetical protein